MQMSSAYQYQYESTHTTGATWMTHFHPSAQTLSWTNTAEAVEDVEQTNFTRACEQLKNSLELVRTWDTLHIK
jgi:hypothetical protein